MHAIGDSQCGRCSHYGGEHHNDPRLVQIRISGEATTDVIESCGHPTNRAVDLHVTPFGSCSQFSPHDN